MLSQVAFFVLMDAKTPGLKWLSPNIAGAARRHWVNPDKVEADHLLATPVLSAA